MSLRRFFIISALFFSSVAHAEPLELHPGQITIEKDPVSQQEVVNVMLTPESHAAFSAYARKRVGKTLEIRVAGQRVLTPEADKAIAAQGFRLAPGQDGLVAKTAGELADMVRQSGFLTVSEQLPDPAPVVAMPNPASAYCIAQGGTLEIVDEGEGQVGYCTLPSGERIEEWALFRREQPSDTTGPV